MPRKFKRDSPTAAPLQIELEVATWEKILGHAETLKDAKCELCLDTLRIVGSLAVRSNPNIKFGCNTNLKSIPT